MGMISLIWISLLQISFANNEVKTTALPQINFKVEKYQLENGLTVLLHEDHSVPMISYHTWYKVGSKNEKEGHTGAAHMLEHMMFKGAQKYSGKEYEINLHRNGITNNAFTTFDYTGFYEDLPSSQLELVMDMEVDRMTGLKITNEDLVTEREVVKEERRWRVDNNPMGLLFEKMMGTVFKSHPYKWPVIGYAKDIGNYTVEKLKYFYDTYYVPNNALLVLVGDFKTEPTKKLIEKYYGKLTKKTLPEENIKKEQPQTLQYNSKITQNVQNYSFYVSFQSPAISHQDVYALDLASTILGSGSSSRLYKKLVYEKQLANSASSFNYTMKDHGVFGVGVSIKVGQQMDYGLDIVYNEIYKLRNQLVTDKELEKAKTILIKSQIDALTTLDGKARAIAINEIQTGSYENIFIDLEKYRAVTKEDILKVSQQYLNTNQRSIVVLEPKQKVY